MGSCRLYQNVRICWGILHWEFDRPVSMSCYHRSARNWWEFLMLLPLVLADISDTMSRKISLALVRVASVLCKKETSHLVFEWELLVVCRRRSFWTTHGLRAKLLQDSYMDTCRLGGWYFRLTLGTDFTWHPAFCNIHCVSNSIKMG